MNSRLADHFDMPPGQGTVTLVPSGISKSSVRMEVFSSVILRNPASGAGRRRIPNFKKEKEKETRRVSGTQRAFEPARKVEGGFDALDFVWNDEQKLRLFRKRVGEEFGSRRDCFFNDLTGDM